eukprot:4687136-Prymnesium_polylepis.2
MRGAHAVVELRALAQLVEAGNLPLVMDKLGDPLLEARDQRVRPPAARRPPSARVPDAGTRVPHADTCVPDADVCAPLRRVEPCSVGRRERAHEGEPPAHAAEEGW